MKMMTMTRTERVLLIYLNVHVMIFCVCSLICGSITLICLRLFLRTPNRPINKHATLRFLCASIYKRPTYGNIRTVSCVE